MSVYEREREGERGRECIPFDRCIDEYRHIQIIGKISYVNEGWMNFSNFYRLVPNHHCFHRLLSASQFQ